MRYDVRKTNYQAPTLESIGQVERLTMGHGGSSWDGTCTFTQRGQGNDAFGPAVGQGDPNPRGRGLGGGENNGCGGAG